MNRDFAGSKEKSWGGGGAGVGQGKRCGQRAQGFPGQGDWEFLMQDRALGCFRTNNEKPVEGFVADLATF